MSAPGTWEEKLPILVRFSLTKKTEKRVLSHTTRAVPQGKLPYREMRIPRRDLSLIGNFEEISY